VKLNGGAVDCRNLRFASTNLYGTATQTTVVLIFVNNLIFTVRFVTQSGAILNKTDTAMCDDFVTAYIGVCACCVYGNGINILFIERNICYLSQAVYISTIVLQGT
jgi:hypothetical protein